MSRGEGDVNVVNKNGPTPLDMIEQMPKDVKKPMRAPHLSWYFEG